jgi:UDP-perosamine 4-acetyltransferase
MSVPQKVLVVGAGKHAGVILDILLLRAEQFQLVGMTDADPNLRRRTLLGVPVLGEDTLWPDIRATGVQAAIVAVGDNRLRCRIASELLHVGFELINAIHPTAILARDVRLGVGVTMMAGAVVNTGTTIGDGVIVNTAASVDHDCTIGRASHVAPGARLAGSVSVGEGVLIGIGSCVVPDITIGDWSTVGAGAVVIRDIPPCSVAAGNPAKIISGNGFL